MKNILIVMSLAILPVAATGNPAWPTGVPAGPACTEDLNLWHNPSICSCPEGTAYDERAFLCFAEPPTAGFIEQGMFSYEFATPEDGRKRTHLHTYDGRIFRLVLTRLLQDRTPRLHGLSIEVQGSPFYHPGPDGPEMAIIVDELYWLD